MLIAYHPESNMWILVDEDSPAGLGNERLTVGNHVIITENVITGSNRLLIIPAGLLPTGEEMPTTESAD